MVKKLAIAGLLLMTHFTFAQKNMQDERIQVTGEAEIEIPADQVMFNINLNYRDDNNVKTAFEQHKAAEAELLKFLKDLKVADKNITYSLINFNRQIEFKPDGTPREYFGTQQNVTVRLENLTSYPDFLIRLVNAGFTNVNTAFTSSKADDFHSGLIEKAIAQARKKAEVMAHASGRKLGKVTHVSDSALPDPVFRAELAYAKSANDGGFIAEIPQSIKKSISLNVAFMLE